MITLKDFMETVDYRITEGSDYWWNSYGPDAYRLDSWNQEQQGHTIGIVFDTRTQEVYEAVAYDYKNERAYRLMNPDYKDQYFAESEEKDVDPNQAWDDVNFVDLDTDEDFLEKARAIIAGEDYDTRVMLPVNLPDEVLFKLMKLAHEQDITLNQLMENILKDKIRQVAREHGREDLLRELDELIYDTDDESDIMIQDAPDALSNFTKDQVKGAIKSAKKKKGKK